MKSLDSIEKSFEDRFDVKLRTINESNIIDFDRKKKPKDTSTFFKIKFSSSIPEETKLFMKDITKS